MDHEDYERAKQEKEAIEQFLSAYFPPSINADAGLFEGDLSAEEQNEIDAFVEKVDENFDGFKGIHVLDIDFLMARRVFHNMTGVWPIPNPISNPLISSSGMNKRQPQQR
jgi:hypothetical protein